MYPLPEGSFAPRNQWYVIAWSDEITRDPIERWVLDEPIALYRKEDGSPVALQGRCPHRHFPLGKSRVVGDDVECGYHGITFAPDGQCVRIPSQAVVPSVCRVKSYPIVEKWKWIWMWPGDPALADESMIPDHEAAGLSDPSYTVATADRVHVPGRYHLMHDNLFDLTHLAYLHQSTIGAGGADICNVQEKRAHQDDWISSERVAQDVPCPPYFETAFQYKGGVRRRFGMKLHLPCLHVGFDDFSKPDGEKLGNVRVYHAITPATKHTAHYFFALGRDFATEDEGLTQAMMAGIMPTIEEDMFATQEIERIIQGLGEAPPEILIRADATCVQGRRLFEAMIRREKDPEPTDKAATAA